MDTSVIALFGFVLFALSALLITIVALYVRYPSFPASSNTPPETIPTPTDIDSNSSIIEATPIVSDSVEINGQIESQSETISVVSATSPTNVVALDPFLQEIVPPAEITEDAIEILLEEKSLTDNDVKVDEVSNIEAVEGDSLPKSPSIVSLTSPSVTKQIPPEKRGGRPSSNHEENEDKAQRKEQKEKSRKLRADVVCWKESRRWNIGVELSEESENYAGLVVTQNGSLLSQDDDGRWVLSKIEGKVIVSWDNADRPIEIELKEKFLLFRLVGKNINRGRLVRYATSGTFLVVVPQQWQRDEDASGAAPISHENVFVSNYHAHFFLLERDNNSKIGFRTEVGEPVIIPTRASRFELIGNELPDSSEGIGPLFGAEPPRICALETNIWNDLKTIVVGQEGSGKKRWRTHFNPDPDRIEQNFPAELYEKGSGWYFVRFYDGENTLVESLDFRFVSSLREIKIFSKSALPNINGHSPASIEFSHGTDCIIKPADPSSENLSGKYDRGLTSAIIPPTPSCDETCWLIQSEDEAQVEVKILVERVWWAIAEEGGEEIPNQWTDKPLNVPREIVTATSKHTLRIRLPRSRWAKEIRVGFEQWKARSYYVEVDKREITISLSHFEGAQELEDQAHECVLKLWIKEEANQNISATIATIPPMQSAFIKTGRIRSSVRRMRNYLKRLEHKMQDLALRQMISETREKWSASSLKPETGSCHIETSCVITLAWENFRIKGIKPLGHRKQWIKKLLRSGSANPEVMKRVRENYESLKR